MSKLLLLAVFLVTFFRGDNQGSGNDRVGLFSTFSVGQEDNVDDIACAFCTVDIQGDVHGDIAILFGTVSVSSNRTIGGDVAVLFSTLHFGENVHIGGDLATALSSADLPSSTTVSGDRAAFAGRLSLEVLAGPILILAGIIGLILFLVRRRRYPYPV